MLRIRTGVVEPIEVYAVDSASAALTGLTDLFIRIRRNSDGFYLDWADDTFKAAGWTTLNGLMAEDDATNAPGLYSRNFDTGAVTNPSTDDIYTILPLQTPGTTARLPGPSQIHVGDYVDDIPVILADTNDIQTRLPAALVGGRMDSNIGSLDNDVITAAAIATDAIDSDALATDALGALELAADAAAEIADAVWDEARAGHTAPGTFGEGVAVESLNAGSISSSSFTAGAIDATAIATDAIDADAIAADSIDASALATDAVNEIRDSILSDSTPFQGADVAAILADTADMQPKLGTPVTDVSADIAAIQADTDNIQTRLPAALVGGRMDSDIGNIQANAIDAASIATDAIDSDAIATDALGALELAAGAAAEIADAVWDEAVAGHLAVGSTGEALNNAGGTSSITVNDIADGVWDEARAGHTAVGSFGESVRLAAAGLETDAVNEVRDSILSDSTPFQGADVAAILTDTADMQPKLGTPVTDVSADIAAIQADTDNIQTRLPAALVGGRMDADVGNMQTDVVNAAAIATDAIDSDAIATDAFGSLELAADAAAEIADAVWDEALAAHLTVGSTGEALNAAGSMAAMPSDIADAVWDEARSGHVTAGTFGESVPLLATGLATDAVNEIRDSIISDATPFQGSDIAAILADTADMQPKLGTPVTDVSADIAAIQADTDNIQTRLPAALVSGRMDSDIGNIQPNTVNAAAIATDAIDADSIATDAISADAIATNAISADAIATDAISADAIATDALGSLELAADAAVEIAAAVWDEPIASHLTAGTTGKALDDAKDAADAASIADAVWDEDLSTHTTPGSAGVAVTNGAGGAAKIDSIATLDPSAAAPGSLLDRLANKDVNQTYDQSSDSLEAIRDRIG